MMKGKTAAKIGAVSGLVFATTLGGFFNSDTKPEEPNNFAQTAYNESGYSITVKNVKLGLSESVNRTSFSPKSALAGELTAELIKAEGDENFKRGDYVHAAEKYNKALEKRLETTQDQYMTHLNLGFILIELGKSKDALPHYEAARKLGAPFKDSNEWKGDSFNLYNKGIVYEGSGDLKKAIEIYEEAQKEDPSNPTIRYEMATVYMRIGNIKKAEEFLKENIRENPLYPRSYSSLGSLSYPNGPCEKFKYLYLICLTINPDMSSERKALLTERINECSK